MFGLEQEKGKFFEFDLEKELKADPKKAKELQKDVETKINKIKASLRQGAGSEDFDKLGIILQGYSGLLRVLTRINNPSKK